MSVMQLSILFSLSTKACAKYLIVGLTILEISDQYIEDDDGASEFKICIKQGMKSDWKKSFFTWWPHLCSVEMQDTKEDMLQKSISQRASFANK